MLRACDTVSLPLATVDGATQEQEAARTPSVHVDTEFHGDTLDIAHDDGERVFEADM